MNRRSFITKALAGLAAVPLLGKIAEAMPRTRTESMWSVLAQPFGYQKPCPVVYGSLPLTRTVFTLQYHIATVTIGDGPMSIPKSFRVSDEHGDHEFEVMRMRTERGKTEVTGSICRCLDADSCTIGCPITLYQERVMWRDMSGNGNDAITPPASVPSSDATV